MLKKILSVCLVVMTLAFALNVSVFAQKVPSNETVARQETKPDAANDLKASINSKNKSSAQTLGSNKSTLAEYQKTKQQGKGFSTTTKVLIGVGIAAAVVGVIVFAASRDKIRTF